jgi:predicted TIM-barrel enzyme/AraC-like DNA-binding protein
MAKKQEIYEKLHREINVNHHILGVALGSGLTAKYAEQGGADFLLVLNSGKFRQLGRSSFAGFMPYSDSNGLVMDFGSREIMPLIKKIPLIFGLHATDPLINLETYIDYIQLMGFDGINNYPSVGLIDGQFREALEESGLSYQIEVEAIRIASEKNLFTVAFVFDEHQAELMTLAGADIIVAHLGFTIGGMLGAKKIISLQNAKEFVDRIFAVCDRIRPDIIKVIYGGPVKAPIDVQYMYNNTKAQGYIGGSAIERIPIEKAIFDQTRAFKSTGSLGSEQLIVKMLDGITKHYDYVEFVMKYVAENYMNPISLSDLAKVAHISLSHISTLFRKETGLSFRSYLVEFRIKKAIEILEEKDIPLFQLAEVVGYKDYAQFSKMFKKITGKSPKAHTYNK